VVTTAPVAPRLVAADAQAGILLMEDLGPGPSLADALLAGDRERAQADLVSYAEALAAMHAWSMERPGELAGLRAGAAIALAPSRSAETFGLAAAEAMAAGLPLVASRVGALAELVEPAGLVQAGDADALARAMANLAGDRSAGERARERVRGVCAPEVVAKSLAEIYDGVSAST